MGAIPSLPGARIGWYFGGDRARGRGGIFSGNGGRCSLSVIDKNLRWLVLNCTGILDGIKALILFHKIGGGFRYKSRATLIYLREEKLMINDTNVLKVDYSQLEELYSVTSKYHISKKNLQKVKTVFNKKYIYLQFKVN